MEETTIKLLESARKAVADVAKLTSEQKNEALRRMAAGLEKNFDSILIENAIDVENARGKISDVMIDRLRLTEGRIRDMADGIRNVALLPDPVFSIESEYTREDGLIIRKVRVPLGVVAIIYESRPNVTSDAAALAFKSGNVCVLRGGKESYRSSAAIVAVLKEALSESGINPDAIGLVSDLTHESANTL
ncbi:MAG: aldehyde dehydrogenase family protein, partial [Lachnospiraceae bacterium]|nr:aldehyde dehydrogenase family protein [Lachnospiraceae bacterium]